MKRDLYIVALILLTFFVISFITNVIGPLIPAIITSFHLNLTLVALLPFAFFIAYGVTSIPTGMLIEKYKEKRIMIAGFLVSFAGSLILAIVPNYLTAVLSLFLIGCGMAMLQVVINPLLRIAGGEEHYAFNSVLAQLIFGLASFISPLVYSSIVMRLKAEADPTGPLHFVAPAQLPWISMYWLFAVLCLMMTLVIALSRFPAVALNKEEEVGPWKTHVMLFKKPVVISFFIAMICYVGTEQGVANWISQFLQTYHRIDPQTTGAQTVAYFWGLMTVGGIVGLLLLKIFDSRKVLITFTLLAMLSLTFALFGSANMSLVGFPLVGFFASVMFPVIFSLALNSVTEHHGSFAGIIVTGIIGGAIVPLIIGWIGDRLGLRSGMLLLYVTMGYILSVGFWAKPLVNNATFVTKKAD
ncbi:MAG: sugar transporter [Pedobacter sp.]|jgi:FHS family L-fucose permease-like MFS transporter|nr:sugar transporter [Pedobacter sp.]